MKITESNLAIIKESQSLQTLIKKITLDEAIKGTPTEVVKNLIEQVILKATKTFKPLFKMKARTLFARGFINWNMGVRKEINEYLPEKRNGRLEMIRLEPDIVTERGDRWLSEEQYRTRVKQAYKRIVNNLAGQDLTDDNGRPLSIRWLAEVEARHEAYVERVNGLVEDGEDLVWVSSHANASERCAKWQGRLYSLNHTSGTINGIEYEPLENAVEIYVTTKRGKQYRNGLFGFNCRHDLYPYRNGSRPPKEFTPSTMNKERAVDKTMRGMENEIIRQKTITYLAPTKELKAESKAISERLMEQYKKFCDDNERSWSLNRTTIMEEELEQLREKKAV